MIALPPGRLMRVKFFATFRQIAGEKEMDIAIAPGDTVREALERLFARLPALRLQILSEAGAVRPATGILVRGRNVRLDDGLDTRLEDGDDMSLFPPLAGG